MITKKEAGSNPPIAKGDVEKKEELEKIEIGRITLEKGKTYRYENPNPNLVKAQDLMEYSPPPKPSKIEVLNIFKKGDVKYITYLMGEAEETHDIDTFARFYIDPYSDILVEAKGKTT